MYLLVQLNVMPYYIETHILHFIRNFNHAGMMF